MKITEIREKTSEQLTELLKEQKAELFNLRFQHAETKKNIAKILTVMTEKKA